MKAKLITQLACLIFFWGCSTADESAISLNPISIEQWYAKLGTFQPDVLVVDVWATWCASCIEKFPKIVELHKRYHDRGVRFVSLNLDDHDDKTALKNAQNFLRRSNANFEHYLIDENMMHAFEKLDLISLPAVLIYDQRGEERFRLTGDNPNKQFTHEDIESAILELLADVN